MAKKKSTTPIVGQQSKRRTIVSVPGNDLPTYYVNNVNVDLSNHDARLRLGQIQDADETELRVKEVAYVFMSHTHFRALAKVFTELADKMDSAIAQAERKRVN
jgi:hypothetical protein